MRRARWPVVYQEAASGLASSLAAEPSYGDLELSERPGVDAFLDDRRG